MFLLGSVIGYDVMQRGARPEVLYGGLGLATLATLALSPSSRLPPLAAWIDALMPLTYLITWGGIAVGMNVLYEFAVAFACTPLILVWLYVYRSKVKYDLDSVAFVWSRSSLYAGIRAVSAWGVREGWIASAAWSRLIPLGLATAESVLMYVCDSQDSYTFAMHSLDFATYACLKSVVFVAVPWVEDALLAAR